MATNTVGSEAKIGDLISFAGESKPVMQVVSRSGGYVRASYLDKGSEIFNDPTVAVFKEDSFNLVNIVVWEEGAN